jgi:phosphoribosylanthranilate isomerase
VAQAITLLKPQGVDVSSGVERKPGDKDLDKVKQFLTALRSLT